MNKKNVTKIIFKTIILFFILLISCTKPKAVIKCENLINKKVLVNKDTLTIIAYNYSLYFFDGLEDEFILSNNTKISYYDIDNFLITNK